MRVIGLDLGTQCGWSVLEPDGTRHASGTWDLSLKPHEGQGLRPYRLIQNLNALVERTGARIVAYEIPPVASMRGWASMVIGALLGALHVRCDTGEPRLDYKGFAVATVKAFAAGRGNARKPAMVATANARWHPHRVLDDNEADALWVAAVMLAHLGLADPADASSPSLLNTSTATATASRAGRRAAGGAGTRRTAIAITDDEPSSSSASDPSPTKRKRRTRPRSRP